MRGFGGGDWGSGPPPPWEVGSYVDVWWVGEGPKAGLSYYYGPFEKGGYIVLHMSVGRYLGPSVIMSVSPNLVQLITQEHFAKKLQTW